MVTLFRQEQYWKSNGVELKHNTLANWIIHSSQWLKPLPKLGEKPKKEDLAKMLPWSKELPEYCKNLFVN